MILGVVSPVGEQGGVIARTAALNSGLPENVPGTQIDRFCASGLEATNLAAAKVASGFDDLVLAGGVESMSRVPMGSDGGALFTDPMTAYENYIVPQGIGADLIATIEASPATTSTPTPPSRRHAPRRPGPAASSPSPWYRCAT